jgi:hypothetical protein
VPDPYLIALAAKLVAAALVVVTAALLTERSGPFIGSLIVTLPISTGPSYVFLAMEHPPEFMADSALGGLVANAATPIFMAAYALAAQRLGAMASVVIAASAWAVIAGALLQLSWSLPLAVLANICLYGVGAELMNRVPPPPPRPKAGTRWWDIPLRAATVMTLSGTVIATAHLIGPTAAGAIALAPLGLTSLALVMHPRVGGPATAAVFASALPGMVGFVAALFTVHIAVVPLGSWAGLAVALGVSVAWNCGLLLTQRLHLLR